MQEKADIRIEDKMGRLDEKIAVVKCKIAKSSRRSKDMELAKRLFDISEKLVGR